MKPISSDLDPNAYNHNIPHRQALPLLHQCNSSSQSSLAQVLGDVLQFQSSIQEFYEILVLEKKGNVV